MQLSELPAALALRYLEAVTYRKETGAASSGNPCGLRRNPETSKGPPTGRSDLCSLYFSPNDYAVFYMIL